MFLSPLTYAASGAGRPGVPDPSCDVAIEVLSQPATTPSEEAGFESELDNILTESSHRRNRGKSAYQMDFSIAEHWFSDNKIISFLDVIHRLGPDDVYVDYGAGEGVSLTEIASDPQFKGKGLGVDFHPASEKVKGDVTAMKGKLAFLGGKTIEEFEKSGALAEALPEGAAVSADKMGPDTYSVNFEKDSLSIQAKNTRVGGLIFFQIPTVLYDHSGYGTDATKVTPVSPQALAATEMALVYYEKVQSKRNAENPFFSGIDMNRLSKFEAEQIKKMSPDTLHLLAYLQSIQGLQLIAFQDSDFSAPGVIGIFQKTSAEVVFPELKTIKYKANFMGPPVRDYEW